MDEAQYRHLTFLLAATGRAEDAFDRLDMEQLHTLIALLHEATIAALREKARREEEQHV